MVDTLTMTLSRAFRSFMNPRTAPSSIERWAEIEFGKDSKFAMTHYNMYGTFPSEKHLR
jgi:hypothetical protein